MKSAIRIFATLSCFAIASSANADYVAYNVPVGSVGNQSGFTLGLDFGVTNTLVVTQLGLFDSGGDGFSGRLNVRLYDISNISSPTLLASAAFTGGNPGVFIPGGGTSRFLNPIVVGGGSVTLTTNKKYSIVADGFTSADPNGNYNPSPSIVDSQIIATGLRYTGNPALLFPDAIDSGPSNKYLAGTFAFVPEPGSIVLTALGIVGMVGYGFRKKQLGNV